MTLRISLTLAAMLALCACSRTSRTPSELDASVSTIKQYAASFTGLNIAEARSQLTGATIIETDWKSGKFGGKQLVATFPVYQIRVMFLGERAITASVQIFSKASLRD